MPRPSMRLISAIDNKLTDADEDTKKHEQELERQHVFDEVLDWWGKKGRVEATQAEGERVPKP